MADDTVKHGEDIYREVVENLHEGIWAIDKDANTTFVNARMADMLGYTTDEMIGRQLFSFMDERGVESCMRNLKRREEGIAEDHEFELLRKDGERICTIMQTSPITDAEGNYAGALAGVLDITKLRVYYFNPSLGWVRAAGGDGWLVPGSRIEYLEAGVETVEFQIAHAAPMQFLDASPPADTYDLTRDMVLDSEDLFALLSLAGHRSTLTDEQIEIGDLNGDGTVDVRDVVIMLRELRDRRDG